MDEEVTAPEGLSSSLEFKFFHGFIASISVIIVSELGDKTFFIAAIMAMRHNRWTVFMAALSALILMTILSVSVGVATAIFSKEVIHFVSIILFLGFGAKMLKDGYTMTEEEAKGEYEEVQKSLQEKESGSIGTNANGTILTGSSKDLEQNILNTTEDPETGILRTISSVPFSTRLKRKLMHIVSLVYIETFTMTLVAELGDRSQITTIILAAKESTTGVTIGAILGHAICTGIAVVGGRLVATMISVRTVTIAGGFIFIFFAVTSMLFGQ
ncbi:transmembrane protein 165-like [Panonychus citri]|uniref:transmembrane protein 165-like n=1 Tax=Panonychus citri TaxID=50023 RepID=UPI00230780FA|nr:transmembrane protein 165-like [Panonychus citri]